MQSIRVVIAEDDKQQAEDVAGLVRQLRSEWHVSHLVHDCNQLATALEEVVPDILLLDLHMPHQKTSVLDIVRAAAVQPSVVLITGDPSQALEAFESAAADYVVKPVRPARLAQALQRAEALLYARRGMLTAPAVTKAPSAATPQWLSGTRGRDVVMIDPTEILYLQAERKYTCAVMQAGHVLMRYGISDIESLLDPANFVRIHRSTIVNIKRVDFLRRDEMGRLRLHLKGRGDSLIVSRSFEYVFKGV